MRVVCAWCDKLLKAGKPGDKISHGMCEECYTRNKAAIKRYKDKTKKKE
jgi:hypothetical protein